MGDEFLKQHKNFHTLRQLIFQRKYPNERKVKIKTGKIIRSLAMKRAAGFRR